MQDHGIESLQIIFVLLLLFVSVFAALAKKISTPYPIVLVIAGLLLSFVPGMPRMQIEPAFIFFIVLPPLLYYAAWLTSWRDFSYNLVSILFLAFGLVAFTVFGVAHLGHYLFSGIDWQTGFVLGAVVSTTDAIAATAIAKRIGLPQRIVDVLEGESLVNDATGLLALEFGTAMVVQGQVPEISAGLLRLFVLVAGGIAVGLVISRLAEWWEEQVDDAPIEIAMSLLIPYTAYLGAEWLHVSGVLAVVTCGLYLSRRSSRFFSATVRIEAWAFWNSLSFILNGLVFVLVGLQLPTILDAIRNDSFKNLLMDAALFCALIIALRMIWTFPGAHLAYQIRRHFLHQNEPRPRARNIFVVGWTGMRGVIALAAAISLPQTTASGAPFPHRNLIIFLTFSIILVTLVLQGLTLPPLIRVLGLAGSRGTKCEEQEAVRIVTQAALDRIEELRRKDDLEFAPIYDDLAHHYQERLERFGGDGNQPADGGQHYERHIAVTRELLQVERKAAVQLRDDGRINDEVLRQVERELDLNENRLNVADGHG